MGRSRAAGLLLGYAVDRLVGDPRRWHPVAGFGRTAGALERVTYGDTRLRGVAHVLVLVGGATALGVLVERSTRQRTVPHVLVTAAATWTVLGGTSLDREAAAVEALLSAGDLPAARERLTHLVGRRTGDLDEAEVARAVIESVAENTSDAVVAPLLAGAVGGVPGLLGYRAANTLDAMVGHRSPRYQRFGWAAARLDDLLNLPGARLAAALAVACGEARPAALRAWRRDARHHPSPNAGPVEAAFAGALGVRLGGRNAYGTRVEDRPLLGDGPPPGPEDIARARALARRVDGAAAAVATLVSLLRPGRRRGSTRVPPRLTPPRQR